VDWAYLGDGGPTADLDVLAQYGGHLGLAVLDLNERLRRVEARQNVQRGRLDLNRDALRAAQAALEDVGARIRELQAELDALDARTNGDSPR